MRREVRVLGEVVASKPAWKHRRASENDDELLQLLADGLGGWIARHEAPASLFTHYCFEHFWVISPSTLRLAFPTFAQGTLG